jgi:hypothetical protein
LLHNHFHNQPVHDVVANSSSVWLGCPSPCSTVPPPATRWAEHGAIFRVFKPLLPERTSAENHTRQNRASTCRPNQVTVLRARAFYKPLVHR